MHPLVCCLSVMFCCVLCELLCFYWIFIIVLLLVLLYFLHQIFNIWFVPEAMLLVVETFEQ
jgi:hypothetical protein